MSVDTNLEYTVYINKNYNDEIIINQGYNKNLSINQTKTILNTYIFQTKIFELEL